MTTKINELKTALFAHKEVLICSHIRPDGDTIGATLALREVLLTKGILVDIVCDSSIPQKFSYLSEVKEYKRVEEITKQFEGVQSSFAMQSGREVRVMVKPEEIDDTQSYKIAREMKEKIEKEMQYPGTIKITVIRETRAQEEAK